MTTRERTASTLATICATMAGMVCATAQETPAGGKQWTLQECIDYAMENNLTIKDGELTLEQTEVEVESATGQLLPSLSFSTSHNLGWRPWSQSTVALNGGTMTSTQNETTYSGNYSLMANWTVWDGGRTRKQRESYRLETERTRATNSQTVKSIEEQIVQLYVQILYETDAARVADSTMQTSLMLLERGRAMMEAGQMAKVDVAQLEAQAAQDRYTLVSTQTQIANYKLQLKQILQIVKTTDFDVATPEIDDAKVMEPLPILDDAYAAAMETRPEIASAKLSIEQADIQERIARAGHYPTISLSAGIQTSHNSASDDSFGEQMKRNVNNSIGVSLNVPIIDNRQTRTNISKAKIQRRQSEISQTEAEDEVYSQVETYWLNAQNAQTQYEAATANEKSMEQSFDLVSEQFTIGLKNIAELTQGKDNLLNARQQRLQSKYTALLNIALLKFYTGGDMSL